MSALFLPKLTRFHTLRQCYRPVLARAASTTPPGLLQGLLSDLNSNASNLQPIPTPAPSSASPAEADEAPKGSAYSEAKAPNPVHDSMTPESVKKKDVHRLYCQCNRHNVIMTFTTPNGQPLAWISGGAAGFKGKSEGDFEAGYQCTTKMFKKIQDYATAKKIPMVLDIYLKGFGQARTALHSVLVTDEGADLRAMVNQIIDQTPIKIGGTRARKVLRK